MTGYIKVSYIMLLVQRSWGKRYFDLYGGHHSGLDTLEVTLLETSEIYFLIKIITFKPPERASRSLRNDHTLRYTYARL